MRLGYSKLPDYLARLDKAGWQIDQQAKISIQMARADDLGLFLPYHEKDQAGLSLLDSDGKPLYQGLHPTRVYSRFEDIPKVLVDAPAAHRKPRTADRGISHPQPGGGMGPARPGPAGKRHQPGRHQPQRAGRQHAADADREIPPFARRPDLQHGREAAPDGHRQPACLSRRRQHAADAAQDRDGLPQHRAAGRRAALRRGQRRRRRSVGLVRPRLRRDQQHPVRKPRATRRRLCQRAEARAVADRRRTPSVVLPGRQPQGAGCQHRRPPRPAGQRQADFARTGQPAPSRSKLRTHQSARRPAAAALRRPEGHQRAAHPCRRAAGRTAPVRPRPSGSAGQHQHQPAGAKNRQPLSAKPGQAGSRRGVGPDRISPAAAGQSAGERDLQLHPV